MIFGKFTALKHVVWKKVVIVPTYGIYTLNIDLPRNTYERNKDTSSA